MSMKKPSIMFRAMVLGAQGIFYNLFCKNDVTACFAEPFFLTSIFNQSFHISFPLAHAIDLSGTWKRKPS